MCTCVSAVSTMCALNAWIHSSADHARLYLTERVCAPHWPQLQHNQACLLTVTMTLVPLSRQNLQQADSYSPSSDHTTCALNDL